MFDFSKFRIFEFPNLRIFDFRISDFRFLNFRIFRIYDFSNAFTFAFTFTFAPPRRSVTCPRGVLPHLTAECSEISETQAETPNMSQFP